MCRKETSHQQKKKKPVADGVVFKQQNKEGG